MPASSVPRPHRTPWCRPTPRWGDASEERGRCVSHSWDVASWWKNASAHSRWCAANNVNPEQRCYLLTDDFFAAPEVFGEGSYVSCEVRT